MARFKISIENAELEIDAPDDYDGQEALMLKATEAGATSLPWFTGDEVFDGDRIDVSACLRVLFSAAFKGASAKAILVEEMPVPA